MISEARRDYNHMADEAARAVTKLLNADTALAQKIETVIAHHDELDPLTLENLASTLSRLIGRCRGMGIRLLFEDSFGSNEDERETARTGIAAGTRRIYNP